MDDGWMSVLMIYGCMCECMGVSMDGWTDIVVYSQVSHKRPHVSSIYI